MRKNNKKLDCLTQDRSTPECHMRKYNKVHVSVHAPPVANSSSTTIFRARRASLDVCLARNMVVLKFERQLCKCGKLTKPATAMPPPHVSTKAHPPHPNAKGIQTTLARPTTTLLPRVSPRLAAKGVANRNAEPRRQYKRTDDHDACGCILGLPARGETLHARRMRACAQTKTRGKQTRTLPRPVLPRGTPRPNQQPRAQPPPRHHAQRHLWVARTCALCMQGQPSRTEATIRLAKLYNPERVAATSNATRYARQQRQLQNACVAERSRPPGKQVAHELHCCHNAWPQPIHHWQTMQASPTPSAHAC